MRKEIRNYFFSIRFVFFVILFFLFTGCDDNLKFEHEYHCDKYLQDSILLEACRNPIFINLYDSLIIINDEEIKQFIKIFNKKGKYLTGLVQIGKGPDEFINPVCFTLDRSGKLWFKEDPTDFYCGLIDFNSNISFKKMLRYDPDLVMISNPIILNDSTVILSSTKDSSLFTTLTLGGSASSGVVDPLYNAGYNRILNQPYLRNQFYYKYLAYNDTLQRMFCAYLRHNKVAMAYLSQGRTEVRAVAQGDDDPPTVVAQNVISQFFAYESAIPYGKYIYCSYLGKPFFTQDYSVVHPSEVHVFDWDLNPVAKLIFESPVADFALADGKMYVISTRERPQILVYQLPI